MAKGRKPHPMAAAILKYQRHRAQAKFRDIEFNITFDEWYDWWLQQGIDKNSYTFDKNDNSRLCMCRYDDVGAYELGNIYCATHVENAADAFKHDRSHYKKMGRRTNKSPAYIAQQKLHKRYSEFRKLRVRFAEQYGEPKSNMLWPANPEYTEFEVNKENAAKAWGISLAKYNKMIDRGEIEKQYTGPSFEQFVRDNSKYSDPYIADYYEPFRNISPKRLQDEGEIE